MRHDGIEIREKGERGNKFPRFPLATGLVSNVPNASSEAQDGRRNKDERKKGHFLTRLLDREIRGNPFKERRGLHDRKGCQRTSETPRRRSFKFIKMGRPMH
jgi:hypothetical protein